MVGERLARVGRKSTCRLTHYGRKSGRPYEVTIWFLVDGDTVYLTTMNMQRQWTRNVQANSRVLLRVGGETFAGDVELSATGRRCSASWSSSGRSTGSPDRTSGSRGNPMGPFECVSARHRHEKGRQ